MNKVITIGAIVGLVAAGTALYLQSQKKSDNVKIGYMTTLSGGAGIIGKQMQNAVNLAMEHKGGKLGGMNAEIIFADDQRKPDATESHRLTARERLPVNEDGQQQSDGRGQVLKEAQHRQW